jgi:L-seryl-tRNA(Ser) seleniumtransferase
MNLAALEQTLLLHLNSSTVSQKIPTLKMLSVSMDELHEKAIQLETKLKQIGLCDKVEAKISEGFAGGGTLPDQQMPTWVVDFSAPNLDTQSLSHKLRTAEPSLFTRIKEDKIVLDLRTLKTEEIDIVVHVILSALKQI